MIKRIRIEMREIIRAISFCQLHNYNNKSFLSNFTYLIEKKEYARTKYKKINRESNAHRTIKYLFVGTNKGHILQYKIELKKKKIKLLKKKNEIINEKKIDEENNISIKEAHSFRINTKASITQIKHSYIKKDSIFFTAKDGMLRFYDLFKKKETTIANEQKVLFGLSIIRFKKSNYEYIVTCGTGTELNFYLHTNNDFKKIKKINISLIDNEKHSNSSITNAIKNGNYKSNNNFSIHRILIYYPNNKEIKDLFPETNYNNETLCFLILIMESNRIMILKLIENNRILYNKENKPEITILKYKTMDYHKKTVFSGDVHPIKPWIITGGKGKENQLIIWNIISGKIIKTQTLPSSVINVQFNPKGNLISIWTKKCNHYLWNLKNGKIIKENSFPGGPKSLLVIDKLWDVYVFSPYRKEDIFLEAGILNISEE